MDLQKRDRGSVRTARDIERKYNLGRIVENGKKADMASEQIDKLLQDTKELENKYTLIQESVDENKQKIDELEEKKASKEELKNYYTKKELEERLDSLITKLPSFTRRIVCYETRQDFEDCFKIPEYKIGSLVDVFINGLRLEKGKYEITLEKEEYFVNLKDGLDVIGTLVEINIIEGIKEDSYDCD